MNRSALIGWHWVGACWDGNRTRCLFGGFSKVLVPRRRLHLGAALIAFPEYASATVSLT